MLKKLSAIILVLCFVLAGPTAAAVNVYVDGKLATSDGVIYDGSTYVPLRALSNALCRYPTITWNGRTAAVSASGLYLTATPGSIYIEANGRYLYAAGGVKLVNGTTLVPVRTLAKALGASVEWDGTTKSVYLQSTGKYISSGSSYYNSDELYWLSRIISAESQGEPLAGKVAVGAVVLNRVASSQFPNSIYGVIFDRKYGVQFQPIINGTIYNTPTSESVIAAKLCLDGANNVGSSLYFLNPAIASNYWIMNNRTYVTTIGNHSFYA